ncbi:DUF447 domain-containing protein [Thalassoroseus pseudoceratinae]|uniref:DUF447 domain-containing protein n=1 Tax=Thalassoroseus pseudoceratinae TaxID=2713176 RepID=UPI00141F6990|nr:DUF447 domain-containing protein [Thalassoroseus pseudoceratinae]
MILEGIVTTRNANGTVNVAPMGPIVSPTMQTLRLRPFQTSTTYQNLKRGGEGVFHVTDDVLLITRAALGLLEQTPPTFAAETIAGEVLADACRWYEFRVSSLDDSQDRTEIDASVIHTGRLRDFLGFNRAKHAVIEAAILATRIHLLDANDLQRQIEALRSPVEKTAGSAEREAFALVESFISERLTAACGEST